MVPGLSLFYQNAFQCINFFTRVKMYIAFYNFPKYYTGYSPQKVKVQPSQIFLHYFCIENSCLCYVMVPWDSLASSYSELQQQLRLWHS